MLARSERFQRFTDGHVDMMDLRPERSVSSVSSVSSSSGSLTVIDDVNSVESQSQSASDHSAASSPTPSRRRLNCRVPLKFNKKAKFAGKAFRRMMTSKDNQLSLTKPSTISNSSDKATLKRTRTFNLPKRVFKPHETLVKAIYENKCKGLGVKPDEGHAKMFAQSLEPDM